jgi:hypothetical protein
VHVPWDTGLPPVVILGIPSSFKGEVLVDNSGGDSEVRLIDVANETPPSPDAFLLPAPEDQAWAPRVPARMRAICRLEPKLDPIWGYNGRICWLLSLQREVPEWSSTHWVQIPANVTAGSVVEVLPAADAMVVDFGDYAAMPVRRRMLAQAHSGSAGWPVGLRLEVSVEEANGTVRTRVTYDGSTFSVTQGFLHHPTLNVSQGQRIKLKVLQVPTSAAAVSCILTLKSWRTTKMLVSN